MRVNVKVKVDMKKLIACQAAIQPVVYEAVRDVGDSLAMTSSGAAPHDEGILDSSYKIYTRKNATGASTTVRYSATNDGFDYAPVMHDGEYNLGPGSLAKPGGQGMSGTHYVVGPKFLDRPLFGEAAIYTKYVGEKIERTIEAFE